MLTVWAFPRSLAATRGIISSPRPTEMFQFGRCPPYAYGFSARSHPLLDGGLPHSEIIGSLPGCWLPDAYRSCPRPSSARNAKASTACLFFLLLLSPVLTKPSALSTQRSTAGLASHCLLSHRATPPLGGKEELSRADLSQDPIRLTLHPEG